MNNQYSVTFKAVQEKHAAVMAKLNDHEYVACLEAMYEVKGAMINALNERCVYWENEQTVYFDNGVQVTKPKEYLKALHTFINDVNAIVAKYNRDVQRFIDEFENNMSAEDKLFFVVPQDIVDFLTVCKTYV